MRGAVAEMVRLPDVEISELRYFLAVARAGSFAEGARRAHVSPPAVSKAIKKLEANLDAELFDRSGRHIELTPVGRTLLQRADEVLRALERLGAAVAQARGVLAGEVRVGTTQEFAAYALPLAVVRLREDHPALTVHTYLMSPMDITARLREGDLDVGLTCGRSGVPDDLRIRALVTSPTSTVCGRGHPFYDATEVSPEALATAPFVVQRFFGQPEPRDAYLAGGPPRPAGASVDLLHTAIQMVTEGGFLGHFPDVVMRCQLNHDELRRVPGAPSGRAALIAVTRPAAASGRASDAFLRSLKGALEDSLARECPV